MKELVHRPVLLNEVIQLIVTNPKGVYLDCTIGLGGHSQAILSRLEPAGRLIGIDRDQQALEFAGKRLRSFKNVALFKLSFGQLGELRNLSRIERFTGILFDLGLGYWQISQKERGFSYLLDGPLDMRMDQSQSLSAYDVVNSYSQEQLAKVLKEYGEEKMAKKIAKNIRQAGQKMKSTRQLAEIVEETVSPQDRIKTLSRVFQAIRMEVNQEIEELKTGLALALQAVEPKGRIGVISYHSLEDRLVKQTFQQLTRKCICPPGSPVCVCGGKSEWRGVTKKPVLASPSEIQINPSARSAKFRVLERLENEL